MEGKYTEMYEWAKPYLDTRHNEVHVAIAYRFAQRLLDHYSDAEEAVVLPAVILHDVGWKMIPEGDQLKAFGPKRQAADPSAASGQAVRLVHEVEGARIAREILSAVDYDAALSDEILAIIDGHDSRETALSLNDQLMKDADKLWRFSQTGIEIDHQRFEIELDEYTDWLRDRIDGWMFTSKAKQMARETLAKAKRALES